MVDKTLTLTLCMLCLTVVLSKDVPVNGNCSPENPPETLTVWGVTRDPLKCSLLMKKGNCQNVTLDVKLSGASMDTPETLKTEGFLILTPNNETIFPQVVVTWTPPRSAVAGSELKGFLLEIHKMTGAKGSPCVIILLDFSESNFTTNDYKLIYQKRFARFYPGPEYSYRLDIYTLPRSDLSMPKSNAFTLQSWINVKDTAKWSAAVSSDMESPKVTVLFSLAPKSYGFRSYFLELNPLRQASGHQRIQCYVNTDRIYRCQDTNYPQPEVNATSVYHTFNDVPPGTYVFSIKPVDRFPTEEDKCLCYHGFLNVTSKRRNCSDCTVTTPPWVYAVETDKTKVKERGFSDKPVAPSSTTVNVFTPSPSSDTSSSDIISVNLTEKVPLSRSAPLPWDSTESWVVIVPTVLVVAVVFIVFAFILLKWRQAISRRCIINRRATKGTFTPTTPSSKRIYLLYASDHKYHVNVVRRFATYLTSCCNCQVFFIPWFQGEIPNTGCYEWVVTHIDKSDYVVIINSEAGYNLYDSWNADTYVQFDDQGPECDMFPIAINYVMTKSGQPDFYKKTILTYFEYTSEEFVLKDLNPGIQYKLPKHLKELMGHIHEVDAYTADPGQVEVIPMDNLSATNEGRELQEAITKTKHFQKSNKDWFYHTFQKSHSDDGFVEHDSYILPSTKNGEDEENNSCYTYNTNCIKDLPENVSLIPPSVVASTKAPTDYIVNQLHQINLDSTEESVLNNQVLLSAQKNGICSPVPQDADSLSYPPDDITMSEARTDNISTQIQQIDLKDKERQVHADQNQQFIDKYENDSFNTTSHDGESYIHKQNDRSLGQGLVVSGSKNVFKVEGMEEEQEEGIMGGREV